MATTTRNRLLARLHILLKEQGAEGQKEAIYASYGATSARELTDGQLGHLVASLEGKTPRKPIHPDLEPGIRRLRAEVLKLITGDPGDTNPRARGLGIPNNWGAINRFVRNHTGGRTIPQLDEDELVEFKKKLYAIREKGWHYHAQEPAAPEPSVVIYPLYSATHQDGPVN